MLFRGGLIYFYLKFLNIFKLFFLVQNLIKIFLFEILKLHMWVDNPKVQLVIEDIFAKFDNELVKSKNMRQF